MSKHTKVRNYTDSELIEQMMSLPSYLCIPEGYHIIAVRSSEDDPDKFDDKMYLFKGTECISVFTCTTNTGTYGLLNFRKWSKLGAAVIKSNEIYYFAFEKSDGKRVRHHKGKMPCLRQTGECYTTETETLIIRLMKKVEFIKETILQISIQTLINLKQELKVGQLRCGL